MVEKQKKRNRFFTGLFKALASLCLVGAVGYVIYDGGRFFMSYKETIEQVNHNVSSQEATSNPVEVLTQLQTVQEEYGRAKEGPAAAVFGALLGTNITLREQTSVLLRNVGVAHSERQEARQAAVAYSLALCCNPDQKDTAQECGDECILAKKYELGLLASKLVKEENPQKAAQMRRFHENKLKNK